MHFSKIFLLPLVLLLVILVSCTEDKEFVLTPSETIHKSDIIFHQWENNTIFFDKVSRKFYGIEHTSMLKLPKQFTSLKYSKGRIELESSNNRTLIFSANKTTRSTENEMIVAGVSEFFGPDSEKSLLLVHDKSESISINPDGGTSAVSCTCRKVGSDSDPTDCESGGQGSTSCERGTGGQLVDVGVRNSCSVKCNKGYYSCCRGLAIDDTDPFAEPRTSDIGGN